MSPGETKTIKIRGVPFAATPEDLSQYFGGLFGEGMLRLMCCVGWVMGWPLWGGYVELKVLYMLGGGKFGGLPFFLRSVD